MAPVLRSSRNKNSEHRPHASVGKRGPRSPRQKCNRTGSSKPREGRFLLNLLRCPQENRGLTTNFKSKAIEQTLTKEAFQDGNPPGSHKGSPTGGLDGSSRFKRCLPPHPNKHQEQKIPQVQNSGASLSIYSPTIRTNIVTSHFYESASPDSCLSPPGRYSSFPISGRLDAERCQQTSSHSKTSEVDATPKRSRVHYQPQEILHHSSSGCSVYRRALPNSAQCSYLTFRQNAEIIPMSTTVSSRSHSPSTYVPQTSWVDGGHDTSSPPLSPIYAAHSDVPSCVLEHSVQRHRSPSPCEPYSPATPGLVAASIQCTDRGSDKPPTCSGSDHDRRFSTSRLGRSFSGTECTGGLVSDRVPDAHQYVRARSSSQDLEPFQGSAEGQVHIDTLRQFNRGNLHQQRRGNEVPISVHASLADIALGQTIEYDATSGTYSGSTEQPCGLAQPPVDLPTRMATPPPGGTHNFSIHGRANNRLVCDEAEQAAPGLLLPLPGERSVLDGWPNHELGQYLWLCLPASMPGPADPQQDREVPLHHHLDSSDMATPLMVYTNSGPNSRDTTSPTSTARLTISGPRPDTPSQPREFTVSGMEAERKSLLQEGFSADVVQTMQNSVRESSARSYDKLWAVYVHWCSEQQVNPCTAPLNLVLSFLQSLLTKGLAYRTIGVYRSAISKFHDLVDGYQVGQHPKVSKFMKGVFQKNPPSRSLLPSWDVNVVLSFLEGEPFEPLSEASLASVTLKTIFLVALASARRCSELQALGRHPPYIQWDDGGARLRTVVGFLPKTATPSHLGEDIYLPKNPDNTKLCVVRLLQHYITLTESLMSQHNRIHNKLFVCFGGKSPGNPANKRTISGWLVKIIKSAYDAAGLTLTEPVRAHSTRAQATTRALFNGASLEDIMKAADWRQMSTFISHYALDLWKRQQGAVGHKVLLHQ